MGRIPRGMRGLKLALYQSLPTSLGRIPRGMRGLKLAAKGLGKVTDMSHPSRDAWIEISFMAP